MGFDPATLKRFKSDIEELKKFGLFPSGNPGSDIAIAPLSVITKSTGPATIRYIESVSRPGLFGETIFQGTKKGINKAKQVDKLAKPVKPTKPQRVLIPEVYNIENGEVFPSSILNERFPGWQNMTPKPGWAIRYK